ncbi:MAG: glutamate racemase [Ideonella sp. MAG2]|nr:MAG: glutamate racemase [Ideonella sp. MAG2]
MLFCSPPSPPIGIFDSGVGGLSVAKALRATNPTAPLLYVADSGHAPYGERDVSHVVNRSLRITDFLLSQQAAMVVVACNTATAAAIEAMRQHYPSLPLVGVEPGVKPAAQRSANKRVGVMATTGTLNSPRFQSLVQRFAVDCWVLPVACAGLAAAIEEGDAGHSRVQELLDTYCTLLTQAEVDTVVLGCTHYPFVAQDIAARLGPHVTLLDTANAVAEQAARLHRQLCTTADRPLGPHACAPELTLMSTGDVEVLARLAKQHLAYEQAVRRIDP